MQEFDCPIFFQQPFYINRQNKGGELVNLKIGNTGDAKKHRVRVVPFCLNPIEIWSECLHKHEIALFQFLSARIAETEKDVGIRIERINCTIEEFSHKIGAEGSDAEKLACVSIEIYLTASTVFNGSMEDVSAPCYYSAINQATTMAFDSLEKVIGEGLREEVVNEISQEISKKSSKIIIPGQD